MVINEITAKNVWEKFFSEVGSPSFHQSWAWGEFQKSLGYKIMRLGIYHKDDLIAIALTIKIRSKRGKFLFIPHGPLFHIHETKLSVSINENKIDTVTEGLNSLTGYLKQAAQEQGFSFIRVAPIFTNNPENNKLFAKLGYRKSPIYIHAETMWVLDITQNEDEILQGMRKTTRYLIRKSIKENIKVTKYNDESAFNEFWKLYEATFNREGFTPYPKQFILKEFQAFNTDQNSLFFLGKVPSKFAQEGLPIFQAGSLVLFTKSSGFYHQGASVHSPYPVTYDLQWHSILEAKRRGCRYYNFYGIYKPGRTPTSWKGLTLFKQGFGGFEVDYVPTHDYVVAKSGYFISSSVDKYLAWRRGI
ncbi:hypothetical protein A3A93_03615 [Candidatus Roizmanbacteria bacterium RIFCSPLOWO2_01_FULL_38_12]|uniref:BioF2-like acetyltransferase domain-containing protein n=1 Tax=Candidatus Roizmanbacteria bacterium RIFCSPLOWO2_01_FULL_38_12 TaxID=1802061 RepID=A0A1F7IYT0_9BACT|nr:MAG: hypothetical protein A3F59_02200 [Candidatus Roizmanbacteria bacterium RIFCSPHIGHO2_12_FULL_38_13]OGK48523.1 MAG: hypothetical protein A3A93_03615 [Candidatus Roizmanbacteria bacterium RIFCSPLOWO2_01_FULL_38_12]